MVAACAQGHRAWPHRTSGEGRSDTILPPQHRMAKRLEESRISIPDAHAIANTRMNHGLRFSSEYEISIAVTANSPKAVRRSIVRSHQNSSFHRLVVSYDPLKSQNSHLHSQTAVWRHNSVHPQILHQLPVVIKGVHQHFYGEPEASRSAMKRRNCTVCTASMYRLVGAADF